MMWMSLHPGRSFEEKSGAKHLEKKRRRVEKLMKNLPFSLTRNQKTTTTTT
jgi:RecG-like helicase